MGALLKLELSRALKNRFFVIALIIGIVLAAIASLEPIRRYLVDFAFEREADIVSSAFYNQFAVNAYTDWMPLQATDSLANLFFFASPLIIAFAYSWSFRSDIQSGYAQSVMVHCSRVRYYLAKATASFIAGGLVIVIPLIVNFLIVCCFVPIQTPEIYDATWHGIAGIFLDEIFFNQPFLYVIIRMILDFILAGLYSTAVMALSFFIRQRVSIIIAPFIIVLIVKYVSDNVYAINHISGNTLTIIDHLKSFGNTYYYDVWAIVIDMLIMLAISIIIPLYMRKHDVI